MCVLMHVWGRECLPLKARRSDPLEKELICGGSCDPLHMVAGNSGPL